VNSTNESRSFRFLGGRISNRLRKCHELLVRQLQDPGKLWIIDRSPWQFREDPLVLTRVDAETEKKVIGSLVEYCETIPVERRFMLKRNRTMESSIVLLA
jgi:hypothetical protein